MHPRVALLIALSLSSLVASCAGAPLSFLVTRTMTDDAVLQYGKPSRVWGWSTAGSNVTGCLDVNVTCITALAGADGLWVVEFPAQPAGGPHALSFLDGESGAAAWYLGVLFGDVFVCGGQSNSSYAALSPQAASARAAGPRGFALLGLLFLSRAQG